MASLMVHKLVSYQRQKGLAVALRELGRIKRSSFMLDLLQSVDEALLPYLSPLVWEQINLTGDYLWRTKRAPGKFQPLQLLFKP